MERINVYIPSCNRANEICTHTLFNGNYFNHYIILHNEEQKKEYLKNDTITEDMIIVSNVDFGVSRQRKWILDNLVKEGEWFMMMDDNIEYFTAVDDEFYNFKGLPVKFDKDLKKVYENKISIARLHHLVSNDIRFCENNNIKYGGFAVMDNFFYREKKYRYVGYVISKAAFYKKDKLLNFNENILAMDDYYYTAENLKYFGRVLINNFIFPVAKHYQKGGIGTYEERIPKKRKDCIYLIEHYPGLFRYKKKSNCDALSELQINFTDLKQVEKWRRKFI